MAEFNVIIREMTWRLGHPYHVSGNYDNNNVPR